MTGLHRPVWIAFLLFVLVFVAKQFIWPGDYVGQDSDDIMRLVVVRDFLQGQGWFDNMQYRLGMEGGTPMHWSRLIDLPIAFLIQFFSLFLSQARAEAAALLVWPLLTAVPLLYAVAAGSRRVARGEWQVAGFIGLVGAVLFVLSSNRFRPGSIDHHNVQLAIMAVLAACLVQSPERARSHGLAGFCAALAIAIGAETMPLIAVACGIVAVNWFWYGEKARSATLAFGITLAVALTAFFYLTIPPARYGLVVCDALSLGYYALGIAGAAGLSLAAFALSGRSRMLRAAGLSGVGLATALAAFRIAPQCLSSPLDNLDPLLRTMWLDWVMEAQPVWKQIRYQPFTAGAFYVTPLIAAVVGILAIRKGRMVREHLILLALIIAAYGIALVQIRGAVFSNLLSIFVLAPMLALLRARANADATNVKKGLTFAAAALACVPFVWAILGLLVSRAFDGAEEVREERAAMSSAAGDCVTEEALAPLRNEPDGAVANASNLGAPILRFTGHRTLSAPYHRNQAGMLGALHIAMSPPAEAKDYLDRAGVTLIAFCAADPQDGQVTKVAPDGLYAQIVKGNVPAWLQPVEGTMGKPVEIFRYLP
ncbi:hypothetical protein E2A64_02310 [Pseudohoeflea suaedae]|uniref:GtrA family protein n=1 Tax=Pseudohoeflea suaedae TaxID=877384 RepID=A0A4R5PN86_9HYPH|nr:hypothetical protein [Pseudohoeflea suaedae]TDH37987.1 hypothetical protein E2A64_02310 [Pseudohoeflea suaedae]